MPADKNISASAWKSIAIILSLWVVFLISFYFLEFYPSCEHDTMLATSGNNDQHDRDENQAWFRKYPEYYDPERNLSTLQLLHVVVRHGDRTNLLECKYPKDPYKNETYSPVGFGHLTNIGKRRMYETGRVLRFQYDQFLGDYNFEHLDATSSQLERSRNSLELLLAGLYPPSEESTWMNGFPWQPIAFHVNVGKDNLLGNPRHNCDKWNEYSTESAAHFQDIMKNHSEYFDWLVEFTGWKRDLLSVNLLYNSITTNLDWGYELDASLKHIWPQPTLELNSIFWKSFSDTEETRIAGGGELIGKILEQCNKKIYNESSKKLYIYSGSDFNILFLLRILEQDVSGNPPFGAHVLIELHKIDEEFYLKFLYRSTINGPLGELSIPDCQKSSTNDPKLCAFNDFMRIGYKYVLKPKFC